MGTSAVSFPVRPDSDYTPIKPANSYLRTGYSKTPTNPKGYHWGVDIKGAGIYNAIIQLPERAKLVRKGYDEYAGYYMEWLILQGPWKGRYIRFFHMARACTLSVGTIKNRKYAVGRVGSTGNSTGPHCHVELGKFAWQHSRDPRWDITNAFRNAVTAKDY